MRGKGPNIEIVTFYSSRDASYPEILFVLNSPDACRPSVGEAGIEANGLNH
jgi:hypothetical protein